MINFFYQILSLVVVISIVLKGEFVRALCAVGTVELSVMAGGGMKWAFFHGSKDQKIVCPIIAILLIAVAQWLSTSFSVHFFGIHLSGAEWGWIGLAIGFFIPVGNRPHEL